MSLKSGNSISLFLYQCPTCRASIPSVMGDKALFVMCEKCNKLFHNNAGALKFTALFKKSLRPTFSIGTAGEYKKKKFQVIGALEVKESRTNYYWREYSIKFEDETMAYFVEYDGHWTFVEQIPSIEIKNRRTSVTYENQEFVFFNTYKTLNVAAQGDFFWDVSENDKPHIYEYINPPYGLVLEYKKAEINWYKSEYLKPDQIKKIFNWSGFLPYRSGVFSTQPLPFSFDLKSLKQLSLMYAFVMVSIMALIAFFNDENTVYNSVRNIHKSTLVTSVGTFDSLGMPSTYQYSSSVYYPDSNIVVSPPFKIDSKFNTTAVDVILQAPVSNGWCEVSCNLINEETGQEYFFEIGVEYYSGPGWSEGSSVNNITLSEIPEGVYRLVVKPYPGVADMEVANYSIRVVEHVTLWSNFILLSIIGLIGPLGMIIYANTFNNSRWSNSNIEQ